MFCRSATHISVEVIFEESIVFLNIRMFYHYLELDPTGPIIDGDMVIQGIVRVVLEKYGPAFCIVETAQSMNDAFLPALTLSPWNLITNKNDVESRFIIPINISKEFVDSFVRVKIYVDRYENIPYEEETQSYVFTNDLICAVTYDTRYNVDYEIPRINLNTANLEPVDTDEEVIPHKLNGDEDDEKKVFDQFNKSEKKFHAIDEVAEVQNAFGFNEDEEEDMVNN